MNLPTLPSIPALGSFFPSTAVSNGADIGAAIGKGDLSGAAKSAVDNVTSTILGISITRLITIVIGVIVVAIGISMLRTTQAIIETGSKVAEKAAILA